MSLVRTLRSRLASQAGYSLTELLVTMSILSIVLGGLTQLFTAGLKAETEVAFRYQAQSNARGALSYLRRETHCATSATVTTSGSPATSTLVLTLPVGCPRPQGETAGSAARWCAVYVSTGRFQLYRMPGATCDSTGKLYADYLSTGTVFTYTAPSTALGFVSVDLPVRVSTSATTTTTYRLKDDIVLRNTVRT